MSVKPALRGGRGGAFPITIGMQPTFDHDEGVVVRDIPGLDDFVEGYGLDLLYFSIYAFFLLTYSTIAVVNGILLIWVVVILRQPVGTVICRAV